MGKRSRSATFSPSGDEAASDLTETTTESDDARTTKIIAYDSYTMLDEQHVMHCSLPPHPESLMFASLDEFEVHYTKEHTNRCAECGKNLPSEHFLMLHIDENHNPVREALAAKGEKTYACLVVGCDKKCSSPQKRRLHMIDKHNFPKVYNFRVIDQGIDNAKTLLREGRKRRVSVTSDRLTSHQLQSSSIAHTAHQIQLGTAMNDLTLGQKQVELPRAGTTQLRQNAATVSKIESSSKSGAVDDLERSFAALHFVPRSVISRHARGRPSTE